MHRKWYIGAGVFAALVLGWALFRPELLFVDARANESLPGATSAPAAPIAAPDVKPAVLAKGEFHAAAHEGKGTATVHRLEDGKRILRFTDFKTSNGPALKVYLVAADDAADNATVTKAGFIDLGALKGNVGDQNYEIPADVDLGKYRAATVWCSRFGVNFATAPLKAS
jgi:hypothetical protein